MRLIPTIGGFVAAGLVAACKPSPANHKGGSAPGATSALTLKSVGAQRTGDFIHLTVVARVKNPDSKPLTLSPPAVQMLAGTKKVESFIAPGLEPAVIPAGGEVEAATHWWLAAGDLSEALTLEIGGARAEVKSGSAFALDSLPERKPVSLSFPDWKIP